MAAFLARMFQHPALPGSLRHCPGAEALKYRRSRRMTSSETAGPASPSVVISPWTRKKTVMRQHFEPFNERISKALFVLSVAKQERGFAPNPTKGRGPLETIFL
jgi:hypothetical protein